MSDRSSHIENPRIGTPKSERIVAWALAISLIPIVGFAGGAIAILKGWRRTGRYMMLIAVAINLIYAGIKALV